MADPWIRSLLFVPGHRLEWMVKAPRYGADALILDLEDAVAEDRREAAREAVREAVALLAAAPPAVFVRVNGWGGGALVRDVLAAVAPGLDGVMLGKVAGPADVVALDRLLGELEIERGLAGGAIEIFPLVESAAGIHAAYDVCRASARVRRLSGGLIGNPGGDVYGSVGLRGRADRLEGLHVGAKANLDARAAGVEQIYGSVTGAPIDDLEAIRALAERARDLGATGALAIHPSHVAVLNEAFAVPAEEIEAAKGVMRAIDAAIRRGDGSTRHEGRMLTRAHARKSLDLLARAERFGQETGEYPRP